MGLFTTGREVVGAGGSAALVDRGATLLLFSAVSTVGGAALTVLWLVDRGATLLLFSAVSTVGG
ncbi:MAG TPA: hypothetical protein PLM32_08145, partial [Candidatus Competibacter sp.]|nr:hypothetical protein [Candidatus Competibacter sp.]